MDNRERVGKNSSTDTSDPLVDSPAHSFGDNEPDPDEYLLQRWLELAETVLRKRDSASGNNQNDDKRRPN